MTEAIYRERQRQLEFLAAHRHCAENPIIRRVANDYAHGIILTVEEALAQMVVALSADWHERAQQAFDFCQMFPQRINVSNLPTL